MIVLLLASLLQLSSSARVSPLVQLEITVRPETVTVGGPFQVAVTLRAPRGSVIRFPAGPDSADSVEVQGPPVVRVSPETALAEQTASYRMVAWNTGWQSAALGEALVTAGGVERRLPLTGARVYVESVLPADTGNVVAKPARGILVVPHPWWYWLLAGCLVLTPLGFLIWRRNQHRGHAAPPAAEAIGAVERATEEFRRIEGLGLLESEALGEFVALIIGALRKFLAARIEGAEMSHTTPELLDALRSDGRVPLARLAPLLSEADFVKFARQPATVARARELTAEARDIVREVESAVAAEANPHQAA